MVGYFGNFCLTIALFLSLIQTLGIIPTPLSRLSRPACQTANLFTLASYLSLVYIFLKADPGYEVVLHNIGSEFTLAERFFALWQNHVGIMLYYAFALSGMGAIYILATRKTIADFFARSVIGAQGFIQAGIYIYILFFANPFNDAPANSPTTLSSLNMEHFHIHHLILYTGYVATSIIYSLVLAVLIEGKRIKTWIHFSRPWINISTAIIAGGLLLGHFLYYENLYQWKSFEIHAFYTIIIIGLLFLVLGNIDNHHWYKKTALLLGFLTFFKAFVLNILTHPVAVGVSAYLRDYYKDIFFVLGYFGFGFVLTCLLFLARIKQSFEEAQTLQEKQEGTP